jgi:hypothetical protein
MVRIHNERPAQASFIGCLQCLDRIYGENGKRCDHPRGMLLHHTYSNASSRAKACSSMALLECKRMKKTSTIQQLQPDGATQTQQKPW